MPIDAMRLAFLLAAAAAIPAGAAAARDRSQPAMGGTMGEATMRTMAAQIIDPYPEYDTPVPVTSGGQAAAAIERYRTDKVKKPQHLSTTMGASGGGGGGGGGGK
ncbi:MAG: hypothetical protein LBV50_10660 [Novosphingobium sp.]|jgi:hypothetical protein|nr:hypothetical protein [Novosphingobium sp.]